MIELSTSEVLVASKWYDDDTGPFPGKELFESEALDSKVLKLVAVLMFKSLTCNCVCFDQSDQFLLNCSGLAPSASKHESAVLHIGFGEQPLAVTNLGIIPPPTSKMV